MTVKQKYVSKLNALNQAWQQLNGFLTDNQEFNESFCQDYPFQSCFNEMAGEIDHWVKSAVDYLKNVQCSINQSVDFGQLINIDWSKYDNVEIHACAAYCTEHKILPWEMIDIAVSFEQVEDTDEKSCWSVYLHQIEGGLNNIADFKDDCEAELFKQFILKYFLKSTPVNVNYTVSCTIGQNVNQEALRRNIQLAIEHSDNCTAVIKNFDVYNHE